MSNFKDIFESMTSGAGSFAKSTATSASPDVDRAFKELSKVTKDVLGGSSNLLTLFNDTVKSVKTGDITDIGKNINKVTSTLNSALIKGASFIFSSLDSIISFGLKLQTDILKRTTSGISGGLSGAVNEFGRTINDVMQQAAKITGIQSFGAAGEMMNQVIQTSMQVFSLYFQDRLNVNKAKYAAMYGVGGDTGMAERGAQASSAMRQLYKGFSRDEALAWGNAILEQGVPLEADLTDRMTRVGLSMRIDPGQMGQILDKFKVIQTAGQNAGEMLTDSFRSARAAAEGTDIPIKKIQKGIMEAAANSRFLNTDLRNVESTMQMLTKNQEKFRAAGVSVREDGGKILNELAGGTNKWSDALHVFFGTKGGTEGSPMEGWAKSKFGSAFLEGLQRTGGGGFETGASAPSDMMVQRLDVMKQTMMDASKDAGSDAEALFIQMKLAQETFGMSEETAKVLALTGKDELKALADNPKMADQFKSQKDILSDLKSMAAINENVQRAMAGLAMTQIKYMMATATNTAIIAAIEGGVLVKDDADVKKHLAIATKGVFDSNIKTLEYASKLTGGVMGAAAGPEYKDMMTTFNMIGSKIVAKQTGGQVYKAQTGRNAYSFAEDGRSEVFHGGSGKNIFLPGENGQIFNHNEMLGLAKRSADASGASPSVTTGGSGNQATFNITLNVEATSKESFSKLLEEHIVSRVYT